MVLMVDDDKDALEIYRMLIGQTVLSDLFITKNSGIEALLFLRDCHAGEEDRFPRFILLDLNMPGFGGIEFIEEYEKTYYSIYPGTQIFILTSSVREKDNETVLSYDSVSHIITKPLSKDKLLSMVAKSLQ